MRAWLLAAVLSIAAACGRGRAIYAGSDLPLSGHEPVAGEPPVSAGASAEPPVQPEDPSAMDIGPPRPVDAAMSTDAAVPPSDAGSLDRDAGPAAMPDAAVAVDAGRACDPGRADCDGDPANGCEVDVQSSSEHCGACGRACHANASGVSAATCVGGTCRLTCQFAPILGDCDGDPDNGCETDLWHDADNCSVCGMRCNRCADGVCR